MRINAHFSAFFHPRDGVSSFFKYQRFAFAIYWSLLFPISVNLRVFKFAPGEFIAKFETDFDN